MKLTEMERSTLSGQQRFPGKNLSVPSIIGSVQTIYRPRPCPPHPKKADPSLRMPATATAMPLRGRAARLFECRGPLIAPELLHGPARRQEPHNLLLLFGDPFAVLPVEIVGQSFR